MDNQKILNVNTVANLTASETLEILERDFRLPNQEVLETPQDLTLAQRNLFIYASNQVFLEEVAARAREQKRAVKRDKNASAFQKEDALAKEEAINTYADAIKTQYAALSRRCTLLIEAMRQLRPQNDMY